MDRLIPFWLGLAAGSFVDAKSVLKLEEWILVGKRENSNKEPSRIRYAGELLIMATSAGHGEMEVAVAEGVCQGLVRYDFERVDSDQPCERLICQAEIGL